MAFGQSKKRQRVTLSGYPEVGWLLAAHTHGRGYATEAAQAALAWGDAYLPQARTVCLIDVDNVPSLRLAAACGYREYGRTLYHDLPVVLLERFAPATTT
jgi:RimJ/RimL family protein N-acetyltransferase